MSEVSFTNGPWEWLKDNDGSLLELHTIDRDAIVDTDFDPVLYITKANAHLIAAAPDLYEALERLADLARRMDFSEGVCCCGDSVEGHGFGSGHSPVDAGLYYSEGAIQQSLAALAKARGETA